MRKLDRSKPFGKITPPWDGDGEFDRPAFYNQGDAFFDQHDREIVPGEPLRQIVPHVPGPVTADEEPRDPLDHDGDGRRGGSVPAGPVDRAMTPYDLLRQADSMPWAKFRKQARAILGETCPGNKVEIKQALEEAIKGYEESQRRRAARAVTTEQSAPQTPTPQQPAPAPQGKASGIDLAAWGRGKTEYLFGEVRKAIRSQYGKVVTERHDAVDFLIEQGVITAESARKDV